MGVRPSANCEEGQTLPFLLIVPDWELRIGNDPGNLA
jgi:hypothetical protein